MLQYPNGASHTHTKTYVTTHNYARQNKALSEPHTLFLALMLGKIA